MIGVSVEGLPVAQRQISLYAESSVVVGRWRVLVGASAPYARYVHEGTRRMRARPFLAQALEATRGRVAGRLERAIPQGPRATEAALTETEREVAAEARRRAPVRTGRLRGSIYTRIGRR